MRPRSLTAANVAVVVAVLSSCTLLVQGAPSGAAVALHPHAAPVALTPRATHAPWTSPFADPTGVTTDGTDLWVANSESDTVTELSATTGAPVRTITGSAYDFNGPLSILYNDGDVWVESAGTTHGGVGSISVFSAATGDFIRGMTIPEPIVQTDGEDTMAADGSRVWLATGGDAVVEMGETGSAPVRALTAARYHFAGTNGVAVVDGDLWVANYGRNSLVEINASTGALIRTVTDEVGHPFCVVADKLGHLWVSALSHPHVTELSASTGKVLRVLHGSKFPFVDPTSEWSDGSRVWIADPGALAIVGVSESTGALYRTIFMDAGRNQSVSWNAGLVAVGQDLWMPGADNDLVEYGESRPHDDVVRVVSDPAYGFDLTSAEAVIGGDLWVGNERSSQGAVSVLSTTTDRPVHVISALADHISYPSGFVAVGADVWISESFANAVTEVDASSGALVTVLSGSAYGFDDPTSIATSGSDVWVANAQGDSVTEIDATTGSPIQLLSGSAYDFDRPDQLASDGTHLWVTNTGNSTVTEIDESNGGVTQVLSSPSFDLDQPTGIADDGSDVWVASDGGVLTELDAATGSLVRVINDSVLGIGPSPVSIAVEGGEVFLAAGDTVAALTAPSGSALWSNGSVQMASSGVVADGQHVWVTDDYAPCVNEYDQASGDLSQELWST